MTISGVNFDIGAKQPIVMLKAKADNRYLAIWIGSTEATAILMKLQGVETPRPLTHDLLASVVGGLEAQVTRITVTELREHTFFAVITLRVRDAEVEVDSRPSDALALAVRTNAPIFVADAVLDENGFVVDEATATDSEEVVQAFKAFLEDVNPEDFAG
ncbi:MAG: bifunctional nuclease family protein [Thermoleophilia bacterium]